MGNTNDQTCRKWENTLEDMQEQTFKSLKEECNKILRKAGALDITCVLKYILHLEKEREILKGELNLSRDRVVQAVADIGDMGRQIITLKAILEGMRKK